MNPRRAISSLLIGIWILLPLPLATAEELTHADVAIALDVSKSVSPEQFERATAWLGEVLGGLAPQRRVGIVTFADEVRWVRAVSRSMVAPDGAEVLAGLEREGSFTVLLEGLYKAAEDLSGGLVLLISDGRDETSVLLLEDVLRRYAAERVRIVTLGAGRSVDERALRRLALLTGGAYLGQLETLEPSQIAAYLDKATRLPPPAPPPPSPPAAPAFPRELLEALAARIDSLEKSEAELRAQLENAKSLLDTLPAADSIAVPIDPTGDLTAQSPRQPKVGDAKLEPPPAENLGNLLDDAVRRGDFDRSIEIPGTDISLRIGGRLKLDADHGRVDGADSSTDFRATASRFSLFAQTPTPFGRAGGFLEADFAGDRARIRHAYAQLGPLLAGQTWSNFTHLQALPSTVAIDPVGAVVRRTPQIRWTWTGEEREFALALEDPKSSLALFETDRELNQMPDVTARLRFPDAADLQVSGILRQLEFEGTSGSDDAIGWGVSLSAGSAVGETDRVMFGVLFGEGIGNYVVGLSSQVPAATVSAGGSLQLIEVLGGYAAYEHRWGEKWRSTAMASYAERDRDGLLDSLRIAAAATFNLIWNPVPGFGIGAEFLRGVEEDASGTERNEERIFLAIQFGF